MARTAADGAAVGVALMATATLLEWGARHGLGGIGLFELPRLRLSGWSPEMLIRGVAFLVSDTAKAALIVLVVLGLWWRTRPVAKAVVGTVVALVAVWTSALACAMAFLFHPTAALLLVFSAFLPAAMLTRRHRGIVTALVVLAIGLGLGLFAAQVPIIASYGIVSSDGGTKQTFSPLYGFLPVAIPTVAAALLIARFGSGRPSSGRVRRLARLWALSAVCLLTTFCVAVEVAQLRIRPPSPSMTRVLNEFAFDVYVTGEPPALVWTNRVRAQVIDDIYGETHNRRALDGRLSGLVERITPTLDGGFYIAVDGGAGVGWWKPVSPHEAIPSEPSGGWLQEPDWLHQGMGQLELAVDPAARRLLMLSQVRSRYAVLNRETNEVAATGVFSDTLLSASTPTADPARRAAFLPSLAKDGATSEFDFDSLKITRRVPNHYVTEIAVDPSGDSFWGARPFTGEVLGIDRQTFRVRHRIPVEPILRPIVQDPQTGAIFTCSFLFGGIYRVDPQTLQASKIGWCGRLCRRLRLDSQRRTLWIATADGVCRFPVTGGNATGDAAAGG